MAAVTASSMSSPVSGGAAAIVASLLSRPPVGLAREAKGENPTSDQPHPSAIRGLFEWALLNPGAQRPQKLAFLSQAHVEPDGDLLRRRPARRPHSWFTDT